MNINTTNINMKNDNTQKSLSSNQNTEVTFSDELEELEKNQSTEKNPENNNKNLQQTEENTENSLKNTKISDDNKDNKENILINSDMNVNENKDKLPAMNMNMNFAGNGQPFSSFMANDKINNKKQLANNLKDLAEEAAIMSTMAENIAIANCISQSKLQNNQDLNASEKINTQATKINENGISKLDKESGIIVDTVVKYNNVIMNKSDVEFFVNIVNNNAQNLDSLSSEALEKNIGVSKTLADLIAKSMNENKPFRIDFDNNISIIIKITRDGKLSADFLPSSQVAEAYLKENLPLLKQRFDENNINYGELNQRNQRDKNKDNQRKGRNDE
ncbi:MAG: hypothetical protein Q4E83_01145 [bacterium]|nr:hypothetical protein [bacterium]